LQFFPNQAQFANDLLRDLVFQDFTSLSRNTIAFTAGSSIVLVAPVVRKNCVRERIRVNATLLHCDLLTGRGREISKYYDRWRVQPFGPGIAIEHHAAVFAPHGQIRQCCSETQNRDYLL
jgi:hypothetical protein